MSVTAWQIETDQVDLRWQVDSYALWQAEQRAGRYLLVTNDWSLSHPQMFQLYRAKDGLEKWFHVSKSDPQVSPVYLHQDQRIALMLLLNMLALLAYSLLERQIRLTPVDPAAPSILAWSPWPSMTCSTPRSSTPHHCCPQHVYVNH